MTSNINSLILYHETGGHEGDYSEATVAAARIELSTILSQADEIARLRKKFEEIRDGDVPRSIGEHWRADKKPSKSDRCTHGAWMYETCVNCVADFITAALSPPHADREVQND